ncbi:MAG: metal ABC transporter substrate-binding protein [Christensenellaceae bacterium]|jgi:zinc transport system substrate-binding protein|nr:metal ABC transporter substrate-binding protein [Christensenellaceae bacterium]
MKNKKFILLIALLMAILLFAFIQTSCTKDTKNDGINITVTTFPIYDFVKNIVGDDANVELLLSPGAEVHSYEPTANDIVKIASSKMFVYIGGANDAAIVKAIESEPSIKDVKLVRLMDYVEPKEEELVDGMQDDEHDHDEDEEHDHDHDEDEEHDHDHDDDEEIEYDEHIWLSPAYVKLMVTAIENTLVNLDSANKDGYEERATQYNEKITQLQNDYKEMVDSAKIKKIVVADRFPFRYLVDEFGISYSAALVGCAHDAEIEPATIVGLINIVESENIPYVFYVELSDKSAANTIAEETGCKTALLHSAERPTQAEFDNGISYLSIMRANLEALRLALNP